MTESVGNPSGGHARWNPHHTVLRNGTPDSKVIKIFITDHFARNILDRAGLLLTAVTSRTPVVPGIRRKRSDHVEGRRRRARNSSGFLRMYGKRRTECRHLGFSEPIGESRVAQVIDRNAIPSRTQERYRCIRCVDLKTFGVR
jgi:hypothetical protein